MFRKMAVAYNESPESQRALMSAIQLAKRLEAELHGHRVLRPAGVYRLCRSGRSVADFQVLQDDQ